MDLSIFQEFRPDAINDHGADGRQYILRFPNGFGASVLSHGYPASSCRPEVGIQRYDDTGTAHMAYGTTVAPYDAVVALDCDSPESLRQHLSEVLRAIRDLTPGAPYSRQL